MITVSTLQLKDRAYHHGDLRSALIEAGLTALQSAPIEELSLRALAREVGVSATAVYRHFPDKQALLAALADAGLEHLGRYQQEAADAAGPEQAFGATGRAYVRWALANPALFRLVFACNDALGETVFGQSLAARMLQANAAAATGDEDEARRLVVQAWALVHGLAMLMLDGQLPSDDTLIERAIEPKALFPR
jgi:AcrR family transcriptional regulator